MAGGAKHQRGRDGERVPFKHVGLIACILILFFVVSMIAAVGLSSPKALQLTYTGNVNVSIQWFVDPVNVPTGSVILSLTEPAYAAINQTYAGYSGVFDPWATESPWTAAMTASQLGAHYLVVTNLQDNGSSYAVNFPWRTFNSSSLAGACLVYSNPDVRIYSLVTTC